MSSTYATRFAGTAATDVALAQARGRYVIKGGRRDAVWRVRSDGVVELARGYDSRVELLEISDDGVPRVVASSAPSTRKKVAGILEAVGFASFLAAFPLGFLVSTKFFAAGLLWAALALVAALVEGKSQVRPWIAARFGTDDEWAAVPWRIHGSPTTGNQVVALSALTRRRNDTYYRVLGNGDIEVATGGRSGQILRVDAGGDIVDTRARPKRVTLQDLAGPGAVVWHRVYGTDPDE